MASLSPRSVMVTGANRGIGLEFVRQLLALPTPPGYLFATYRTEEKAKDLKDLATQHKNLYPVQLEVTDYDALPSVVSTVEKTLNGEGLNLLINNAGLNIRDASASEVTSENMRNTYETNTIAPLMITKAFLPLLRKASSASKVKGMGPNKAAIINIGSVLGSIKENSSGGLYSYRASKAAINMVTKNLSLELAPQSVLVAVLHPGWVQTDMGGPGGALTPSDSVRGMLGVITGLDAATEGTFFDYKNDQLPW